MRRRLLASILGASVLIWLASLAIIVHVAWRETSSVFDDSLKESARLALVLGAGLQEQGLLGEKLPTASPASAATAAGEPAKLKLYYQLVTADGRIARRADQAPSSPFSSALNEDGEFQNVWVQGKAWRVYLLRGEGLGFQVQVGQPWDERLDLLEEMADELVWPALGMLALLAGFSWFVIRRLLSPLERTAARIAGKSPHDLQPIDATQDPRELKPIVNALNLVLARLGSALQAERRFTADAAHELRTPLAGLRMRIQLMQRQSGATTATTTADGQALQLLRDDVDRCTHLVESLLTLARLDPQSAQSLALKEVDVEALFDRLNSGPARAQALARHVSLQFTHHVQAVKANSALIESALRNLIDNALRYCPAGSRVEVTAVALPGGGVRFCVSDNGPGVAAADRERLAERFFRVLGSGETGSGLGLSIVARVASLHGGTLDFGSGLDGRGLGVVIDIPA
ncbi:MAG: hypothetical protein EOO28_03130 [Comamonadaceae bacterium]|nr:MAG: hypothetical protein EOO28_03130 [Comamonadaceae bacterium]